MNTLKSIISLTALLFGIFTATAADELTYKWGAADTIAHHTVGPGMTYAKIIFPSKPLILWWVEVDLSNKYAKVEQVQSRHAVPDPLRWDVMTHYRENSRPGHQVRVAWNHDFFSYEPGVCIGMNVSEGEVTWTTSGRSILSITDNGQAEVFCADFDAHLSTPDNTTVNIDYYNALNGGIYGDCVLYNRFNSKQLVEDGRYISLQPLDTWIINGDDIKCRVIDISDSPIQSSSDTYVLYLRGSKLNSLDGHISQGDIVKITQSFRTPKWGISPQRILNAFHGYPSIVHDGKLHDGEYNNFENGREYEKSSRVMAGISRDKKKLYIATTEMSGSSVGVDCIELSAWMVEKGAWDIVNFDSGGSAAIVIDEKMLNLPGRGSVRPVQDAMLAVSTAPEDNTTHHLTFSRPSISPSIVSRTPLRVMSFNQYDEPLCDDVRECQFRCDPPELGYVDDQGVFYASAQAIGGLIIAEKDGMTASMSVNTQPLEKIYPVRKSILVDNHRHVTLELEGVSDGLSRVVDPGAFSWSADPSGIVQIDDNGVLTGIANGNATITGQMDDINMTMDVRVEIADSTITTPLFNNLDDINFKSQSAVKNVSFDYSNLPDGWTSGAVINFDLIANRTANISFSPDLTLYSLPEALSMRILDKTGAAKSVTLQFVDATGGRLSITSDAIAGENDYKFDLKDSQGDPYPYYYYPLKLSKIRVDLTTAAKPGASLAFQSLKALYPSQLGVTDITADPIQNPDIKIIGENLIVNVSSDITQNAGLHIYDFAGQRIATKTFNLQPGCNELSFNIKELPVGIYAAVITSTTTSPISIKFIVK
ncbi:MAG: phosphodiester glycosidase family protein [Muribaculaceae bacterium]|nr:phosphodiester glycosidase family protein [Muribaculaceae bacterium]